LIHENVEFKFSQTTPIYGLLWIGVLLHAHKFLDHVYLLIQHAIQARNRTE